MQTISEPCFSFSLNQNVMSRSSEKDPHLLLENQVCFPLYSAANAMIRAYRPLLNPLGLTYLQYMVLMVLWEESSLKVKELGERLGLDSGTLTPLLKRLASKGLVERERGKDDARVRVITITQAGQQLKEKALDIPKALARLSGMQAAQMQDLKNLCKQLLATLD